MKQTLAELVRQRAGGRCEYCQLPEQSVIPFEIDHIIAEKHDGPTEESNLALACFYCNSAKGPNIAGIDPESRELTRLFHPRNDAWDEHFEQLADGTIAGLSSVGRTTARLLEFNHFLRVMLRRVIETRN